MSIPTIEVLLARAKTTGSWEMLIKEKRMELMQHFRMPIKNTHAIQPARRGWETGLLNKSTVIAIMVAYPTSTIPCATLYLLNSGTLALVKWLSG